MRVKAKKCKAKQNKLYIGGGKWLNGGVVLCSAVLACCESCVPTGQARWGRWVAFVFQRDKPVGDVGWLLRFNCVRSFLHCVSFEVWIYFEVSYIY